MLFDCLSSCGDAFVTKHRTTRLIGGNASVYEGEHGEASNPLAAEAELAQDSAKFARHLIFTFNLEQRGSVFEFIRGEMVTHL